MEKHGQTVCLSMIVKDEAPVIRRCLDSLRELIDCWVIVDTGSTDGTQEIVREHLQGIPGELIERPWVDFGHNRSEALVYARGRADRVLILDADEVLVFDEVFELPVLTHDAYHFEIVTGPVTYLKTQLIDNRLEWRFRGVLHEHLHCDRPTTDAVLPGVRTLRFPDGARARDPSTYRRDALILERALLEEPENPRTVFYLAQSYRDAGENELAIRHYRRRAGMRGWDEEVWYSLYQVAEIRRRTEASWPQVMEDYLAAYRVKPERAEPLFKIAAHYQSQQDWPVAHLFLRRAMEIPTPPPSALFVERPVYDHQLPIEYAVASYYVGDHAAAIDAYNRLLCDPDLPGEAVERVIENRRWSLDALYPKVASPSRRSRPIVVCVPCRDPGHWLDDCVESLLLQTHGELQVVVVDDGSSSDLAPKLPDDPRFRLLRNDRPIGWRACVEQGVAAAAADGEAIVLGLDGRDALAEPDALERLNAFVDAHECLVAYGQHRYATGHLGLALPLSGPAALAELRSARRCFSPLAFRASLLGRLGPPEPAGVATGDGLMLDDGEQALNWALVAAAGLDRTRFQEHPLTVVHLEARRPAAAPAAGALR